MTDPHRKRRSRPPRTNILDTARAQNRPLTPAEYRKLTAPKGQSEHAQQVEWATWMREAMLHEPALISCTAIPHAEQSKAQAGKKWAEGVQAGYPDTLLDVGRGGYFGLRVELKRREDFGLAKGEPTMKQKKWHRNLCHNGFCVVVAWGSVPMQQVYRWYLALPRTLDNPESIRRPMKMPAISRTRWYSPYLLKEIQTP